MSGVKKKSCNTKEGRAKRKQELEAKRVAKIAATTKQELLRKKEREDREMEKEKRNRSKAA